MKPPPHASAGVPQRVVSKMIRSDDGAIEINRTIIRPIPRRHSLFHPPLPTGPLVCLRDGDLRWVQDSGPVTTAIHRTSYQTPALHAPPLLNSDFSAVALYGT